MRMQSRFSLLALTIIIATAQGFSLVSPVENRQAVNLIVTLREGTSGVVEGIKLRKFASREQRHVALVDSLKEHSTGSQRPVLELLNKEKLIKPGLKVESLWITNQIVIKGADFNLISRLSALPQVSTVEEEQFIRLDQPKGFQVLKTLEEEVAAAASSAKLVSSDDHNSNNKNARRGSSREADEQQWSVVTIQAPEVWSTGNTGQNVTVCNIGTGARASHEALRDSYVGDDGGWYDPIDGTKVPEDPNGIGTHTLGVIAGTARGIGVAPGSKWSACKACSGSGLCSNFDLLSCGQWVLCPNSPDCSKAPRVVHNVWGGAGGNNFYDDVLEAWTTAGIIPVFPIGGSGSCSSTSSPGDSDFAIGVGATTIDNQVYETSASGPGPNQRIKPDVVAPGQNILSAFSTSDTAYASISGTSLASPHTAGVIALILHENPNASFEQVLSILAAGGEKPVPSNRNCGGIPETELPNFTAGYGRINAFKSITAAAE